MKITKSPWRAGFAAAAAVAVLAAAVQVVAHPADGPQGAPMGGMQHQGMQQGMHGMGMGMGPGMGSGMGSGMGPGMGRGAMGMMGMGGDPAAQADLGLVHQMLASHDSIKRSVTRLPDGIRTVTESDDPKVVQLLQTHVASMESRLRDGRVFNLFSKTLPVLFENKDKIVTRVENTARGVTLTQTSTDRAVVAALQGHADEVSELARDGMVAMMRGMHGDGGPMGAMMGGGGRMRHGPGMMMN